MKQQTAENAYQATIIGMQEEIHNLQMRIAQLVTEKSEINKELKQLRERVGLD